MSEEEQALEMLKVKLGDMELVHPLVFGAGAAKRMTGEGESLEGFMKKTEAALFIAGSFTPNPREGNSGNVYYEDPNGHFALNRMGLPNKGIKDVAENLQSCLSLADQMEEKPKIGVSIAGIATDEKPLDTQYLEMLQAAISAGAYFVEENLSCPNTEAEVICYSPESVEQILALQDFTDIPNCNICIKVSPYDDLGLLKEVAAVIQDYPQLVDGISTMNTVPNCTYEVDGKSVLDGPGGKSGPEVFDLALQQVAWWRKELSDDFYIIGGGGVETAQNVLDMQSAGADAVFMTTAPLMHGPKIFGDILFDLIEL